MFQFAHPEYLNLLFIIPVMMLVWLVAYRKKQRAEQRLADAQMLRNLTPLRSKIRPVVKFALCCVAMALCILMLARPQSGQTTGSEARKGIEAVIVLDVSQSMLAQDVQPNRLERAKLLVSTLIDKMQDDKVGLAVFAGEAYPQLPVTNDYVSAKLFLDNVTTDMVSLQGTNVGAAIRLASQSFTQEKGVGKAIIVITDGENHEGGAIEEAEAAAKRGRHVYVMGVGSTEGAPIPTPDGLLTDNSGETVRTCLNTDMCKQIAEAGKGLFMHIDGSNVAQDQLLEALAKLQHSDSQVVVAGSADEQFQAFGILFLIILLLEMFILDKQNPFYDRFRFFQRK